MFRIIAMGEDIAKRKIIGMGNAALDTRPAMDLIVARMRLAFVGQFETLGRRGGTVWPPVQPETLYYKRRRGLDLRTLHSSLDLRRSVTRSQDSNRYVRVHRDKIVYSTKVKYGKFHQKGYIIPGWEDRVPARPFLVLTKQDTIEFGKILQDHLVNAFRLTQ